MPPKNKIICAHYKDFLKEIPDKSISCLFTDPPYNQEITDSSGNIVAWDTNFDLEQYVKLVMPKMKSDSIMLIFNTKENIDNIINKAINQADNDFYTLPTLRWSKSNPRFRLSSYRKSEYLSVSISNGESANTSTYNYDMNFDNTAQAEFYTSIGERKIFSVKSMPNLHPTKKPISLLTQIINHYVHPGDLIMDNFSGSGSIALAAWYTHHDFYACELDADYVKLGQTRLAHVQNTLPRTPFLF